MSERAIRIIASTVFLVLVFSMAVSHAGPADGVNAPARAGGPTGYQGVPPGYENAPVVAPTAPVPPPVGRESENGLNSGQAQGSDRGEGGCFIDCAATGPTAGSIGETYPFTATVLRTDCSSTNQYAWSFGDGATSTQQNPTHSYSRTGAHTWSMTVTNGSGKCVKSGTVLITGPLGTCGAYTLDSDFDQGMLAGLEHNTVHDQLQLSTEATTLPFIWVPNSNQGTISKVDTVTGNELARYRTCPSDVYGDPSRTTVDLEGSCWVANRQAGTAVKVGLLEAGKCIDRNANGICDTSRDLNGDCDITDDEILPWGEDECVLYEVVLIPGRQGTFTPGQYTGGYVANYPRAVAVDASNNVWAGVYNDQFLYNIDGETGQILGSINVAGTSTNPYGALIDGNGTLWVSSWSSPWVLRVDPVSGQQTRVDLPHSSYGLGIDKNGHLFVSGFTTSQISRVNIETNAVELTQPMHSGGRGVCVTSDQDVWVAISNYGEVQRFNNSCESKAVISGAGNTPTGVAVDAAGKVWVVNVGDEYIKRINPANNQIEISKRLIGTNHYGYSDMTGIVSRTVTNKIGSWRVVYDSGEAGTQWGHISWTGSTPGKSSITVEARSSENGQVWSAPEDGTSGQCLSLPNGRYLQVITTLKQDEDDNKPVLYDLTVCTGCVGTCQITCSASATPETGDAPLPVTFSSIVELDTCHAPSYGWTFGDGGSSSQQNSSHTYAVPGRYRWTFTASADGTVCTRTGTVDVTTTTGWISGKVGVQSGEQFIPLDGEGVVSGTAYAKNLSSGEIVDGRITEGKFVFAFLPLGSYEVWVSITYRDNISFGTDMAGMGCTSPTGGFIDKEVVSGKMTLDLSQPGTKEANVAFPAPVVFVHGILDCYAKWYSGDPQGLTHWDNAARSAGFISFTPAYAWGEKTDWGLAADQVLQQAGRDLSGLHASAESSGTSNLPWCLVAHDAGGLVARAMGGRGGQGSLLGDLTAVYLMGTPNSGTDLVLGGGTSSPVSEYSIIQRFNEIYPDFGALSDRVYAIGGDSGLWGLSDGDGRVSLRSAFNIVRMACDSSQSGFPVCVRYNSQAFPSGERHIFHYGHGDLGGPPSKEEILDGVILSTLKGEVGTEPESPAGGIVWGTNSRTVTTASGSVSARESSKEHPFTVGESDGVAVFAWVTQGSATFEVRDPSGALAQGGASGGSDPGFAFEKSNPQKGQWKLVVTPGAGGASYSAVFSEDALFGIAGYAEKEAYTRGSQATLRVDQDGEAEQLAWSGAAATVYDLAGGVLQSVTLYDDGAHQDGQASDGKFSGSADVPQEAGSYRVRYEAWGTYRGVEFRRTADGRLNVLPPGHLFTGNFSFAPKDSDGSGKYDTLELSGEAIFPAAGQYIVSGKLYDANGNLLSNGSLSHIATAAGTSTVALKFPLAGARCSQFGNYFAVTGLQISSGSDMAPLDIWGGDLMSRAYDYNDFDCAEGQVQPVVDLVSPDDGAKGQSLAITLSGRNFAKNCTASLGDGVTVTGITRMSGEVLSLQVKVEPGAAPGMRPARVTNPNGGSGEAANAFQVKDNQPPTASIQSPAEGSTLKGVVAVTATVGDDTGVSRVDFAVDGAVKASTGLFPFRFDWDTAGSSNGEHSLTVVAVDEGGLAGTSPAVKVKLDNILTPGDCNGDGVVNIGEVQKAINMFLGTLPAACGADCNGNGQVSIGEVQKVINAFLGLPSSC